jgi:nicotinate-nucleotide adenylyltransferase
MPTTPHAVIHRAPPRRIGIFGGSFDPAHRGHRAVVLAAMRQLQLDRVYVIPARVSPLKMDRRASAGIHRIAMLRLLFADKRNVRVSPIELRRKGVSFTVDTVRSFRKRFRSSELVLIIGEDNLRVFSKWHKPREILRMASVAVYGRNSGRNIESVPFNVMRLSGKLIPHSATSIRERVKHGRSFDNLVTPAVAEYIRHHALYVK